MHHEKCINAWIRHHSSQCSGIQIIRVARGSTTATMAHCILENAFSSTVVDLGVRIAQWQDSCALIQWSVIQIHTQLNLNLKLRESLALCNFHREESPGHCSISKKLLTIANIHKRPFTQFDIGFTGIQRDTVINFGVRSFYWIAATVPTTPLKCGTSH